MQEPFLLSALHLAPQTMQHVASQPALERVMTGASAAGRAGPSRGLVERAEAKLQQFVEKQRHVQGQELVKVISQAMKLSEEQLLRRVEKVGL